MKSELKNLIDLMPNARRVHRDLITDFVLKNTKTLKELLELTFGDSKKLAIKASWILELVCVDSIDLLDPYLDYFIANIEKPKDESIIRPLAKICFLLVDVDSSIKTGGSKKYLNHIQNTKIMESCFDWLINEHNVANHVYAMDALYILGLKNKWIHTELILVLEQNISSGSPGYQVRAKRLLNKLNI